MPFIAFVIFKIPPPLTVMQILAVDLGTDVLPALGLGAERPEKGIMEIPPRRRDKRLLDFAVLARAYLFLGPHRGGAVSRRFLYFLPFERLGARNGHGNERNCLRDRYDNEPRGNRGEPNRKCLRVQDREGVGFYIGIFKNRFVLFGIAAEVAPF